MTAACLAMAAALLLWVPRTADRRAFLQGGERTARVRRPATMRARVLLAGSAGLAVGLLIGGPAGWIAGGAVAVGSGRLVRRSGTDGARALRASLIRDLPAVCDLLAVCLAAGLPVGGALTAVGDADTGPVGEQVRRVAALYRLGAEPRRAWEGVPEELTALGRTLVRADESGAAVVPGLRSLAADGRAVARSDAEAAVRRAGIWVLAPLGACFLPAFVCLGVVPLVLGIAGDVFRW